MGVLGSLMVSRLRVRREGHYSLVFCLPGWQALCSDFFGSKSGNSHFSRGVRRCEYGREVRLMLCDDSA